MCQTPNLNFFPGRGDGGPRGSEDGRRGQAGPGSGQRAGTGMARGGHWAGEGGRRGAAVGLREELSVKLPAPSSLPAWSHPGHLFLMLGPGFGRQPCLSLPGVPKYATEQTEDGLVLVLAARLVSVCVRGHGYPSLALHSPDLPPLQLHRTQLRWQGPSQPSVQKPGTTLRFPNVSGCFSVGAKEHPPA